MKLKNYSTTIAAEKSIMELEKLISGFGASHIMKEYYGDGRVKGIAFRLEENNYRLPANVDGIKEILRKESRVPKSRLDEQAEKSAWRLIKDWVHAQLSMIMAGQAKPDEVMLPYLWDGKKTLYEAYKDGNVQIGYNQDDVEVKSTQQNPLFSENLGN